jgi:hypothetical protein
VRSINHHIVHEYDFLIVHQTASFSFSSLLAEIVITKCSSSLSTFQVYYVVVAGLMFAVDWCKELIATTM